MRWAVVTPDFAHRDPIVAAAEAGKHIITEKPLATTLEDAEACRQGGPQGRDHLYGGFPRPLESAPGDHGIRLYRRTRHSAILKRRYDPSEAPRQDRTPGTDYYLPYFLSFFTIYPRKLCVFKGQILQLAKFKSGHLDIVVIGCSRRYRLAMDCSLRGPSPSA
jgi:hypothetical protein